MGSKPWDLFAVCTPGLEKALLAELQALGAEAPGLVQGGVGYTGDMGWVMRSNLRLRCASRVLVRVAGFGAGHLDQLYQRTRRVDWARWLAGADSVRVKAACNRSRIRHSKAVAHRVERAIEEGAGLPAAQGEEGDRTAVVMARVDRDRCFLSVDSSGEPLYRRGYKLEVTAAPLRETLASALLLYSGYDGSEPLLDPMCGSGTLVLEGGLIALGRSPGEGRRFAFMDWPTFDESGWRAELTHAAAGVRERPRAGVFASDRNGGAVGVTRRNLARAGLGELIELERVAMEERLPPAASGLVICNPPYGARLSRGQDLNQLYARLGEVFQDRFSGWRLSLVTSQKTLAAATGLRFSSVSCDLAHGGLRVRLYQTDPVG